MKKSRDRPKQTATTSSQTQRTRASDRRERKRAVDRECQRAARVRRATQLSFLEQKVKVLESRNDPEALSYIVSQLMDENNNVRQENLILRSKLGSVISLAHIDDDLKTLQAERNSSQSTSSLQDQDSTTQALDIAPQELSSSLHHQSPNYLSGFPTENSYTLQKLSSSLHHQSPNYLSGFPTENSYTLDFVPQELSSSLQHQSPNYLSGFPTENSYTLEDVPFWGI